MKSCEDILKLTYLNQMDIVRPILSKNPNWLDTLVSLKMPEQMLPKIICHVRDQPSDRSYPKRRMNWRKIKKGSIWLNNKRFEFHKYSWVSGRKEDSDCPIEKLKIRRMHQVFQIEKACPIMGPTMAPSWHLHVDFRLMLKITTCPLRSKG